MRHDITSQLPTYTTTLHFFPHQRSSQEAAIYTCRNNQDRRKGGRRVIGDHPRCWCISEYIYIYIYLQFLIFILFFYFLVVRIKIAPRNLDSPEAIFWFLYQLFVLSCGRMYLFSHFNIYFLGLF